MSKGTTENVNVYNKISKGDYICKGNKLYTKDEMKKMLLESGLTRGEVEMLWTLNTDDAMREIGEMAGEKFEVIRPEEGFYLSEDGWTVKEFYKLEKLRASFLIFSIVLAIIFVVAFIACEIAGDSQQIKPVLVPFFFMIFVSVPYLIAQLLTRLGASKLWKEAKYDASVPEDALRTTARDLLKTRRKIMNSYINTMLMYECMEEYLMDE